MNHRIALVSLMVAMTTSTAPAWSAPFTVNQIRIIGGDKVSDDTVKAYLPVKAGAVIDLQVSGNDLLKSLYGSGLFEDVGIRQDGEDLVVNVVQRSVINAVDMTGYRQIGKDVLEATLRQIEMQPGRPLNRAVLEKLRRRIAQIYAQRGYYQATVDVKTLDVGPDSVDVTLAINEGKQAKIKRFDIAGNMAFTQKQLSRQMSSGPSSNFLSNRNIFIKEKIEDDIRELVKFYRDNGYAKVEILEADISMNDARSEAYVEVNLKEGDVYNFGQVRTTGELIPQAVNETVTALSHSGRFRQQSVLDMRDQIIDLLGADGFAFAQVDIQPNVNSATKTIDFNVVVQPGNRVNVRFINFSGNHSTNDRTLRVEMRQGEGELFDPGKLRLSKKRIKRLSYVDDVVIDIKPVNGQPNQVDIVVAINEGLSGDFLFSGGYGSDGWVLGGSISRKNLFGTGQTISAKVDVSESSKRFSLNHHNPYLNESGLSQTLSATVVRNDTSKTDSQADWIQNLASVNASYGIPVSEFGRVYAGIGVVDTSFTETAGTPAEIATELAQFGTDFTYGEISVGLSFDDRDSFIFPTEGQNHDVRFEYITGDNIEYTKLSYNGSANQAIGKSLVATGRLGVASGQGSGTRQNLPFFDRFYSGGIRSVRGFQTNSLGPRFAGTTQAKGGDFKVNAGLTLSLPAPSESLADKMRFGVFVDAGNVYEDADAFESNTLRSSYGLGMAWITPVGPLTFSLAKPIDSEPEDKVQEFQFTIGSAF